MIHEMKYNIYYLAVEVNNAAWAELLYSEKNLRINIAFYDEGCRIISGY